MRWSFSIGRLFGIRVELHVTFLLFVAWIALSQGLMTGDVNRALQAVFLMLLVFGCVLLHELGHALTARRYGIRTHDIVLLPIGGLARLERMPEKPSQEMLVAIAGPLVNVVIAVLVAAALVLFQAPLDRLTFTGGVLEALLYVNVVIVLFNMIPAFPMDGGRVLRAALAVKLPYVKATRIASIVGQAVAVVFGIVGIFGGNILLAFIALFVFLAASEERAVVQTRSDLAGLPVRAAMLTAFEALDVNDPLQRGLDLLMSGSQADFPVTQSGVPVGILTRAELVRAVQERGTSVPVRDVMTVAADDWADPSEPLELAVRRMRERNRSAFPVVQQGALVGLLTMENVSELLMVQNALKRHQGAS